MRDSALFGPRVDVDSASQPSSLPCHAGFTIGASTMCDAVLCFSGGSRMVDIVALNRPVAPDALLPATDSSILPPRTAWLRDWPMPALSPASTSFVRFMGKSGRPSALAARSFGSIQLTQPRN